MAISSSSDTQKTPRFAFAALVVSNIVLSFGPLLVRLADTGPVASAFWRMFLALPFMFLLMRVNRQSLSGLAPLIWGLILVGGLFFATDLASWHMGILRTKIANATLFGNVSSLLLPLWGIMVLRQRPAGLHLVALILATVGIVLLLGNSYELSPRYVQGDLLCLFAGVMYTGYIIVLQRARGLVGSWALLAASSAVSAGPILIAALLMGETVMPRDWTPLVVLALSSQVVGQGLLIYALAWFRPLVIGLMLLAQPLIGAMIGWLAFGETLTLTDAVGAIAMAVALVLVRLPARG